MKITSSLIAIAFLFGIVATTAQAQTPAGTTTPVREKVEDRRERVEINKERKDDIKEKRDELKDIRKENRAEIKDLKKEMDGDRKDMKLAMEASRRQIKASSTEMFKKMKDEKKELAKKIKRDTFEIRKDALVKQLTMTLENLANIRARLNDKITALKAESKDVTVAEKSLADADALILKAKTAVTTLSTYSPATSTTDVELEKPRQVGDLAIKSVKEARDSLKKVLSEIVKLLPKKEDDSTKTN